MVRIHPELSEKHRYGDEPVWTLIVATQLRDDEVNVVARITDQRDSLGVSRHVGLLAALVATEKQLRRAVAAIGGMDYRPGRLRRGTQGPPSGCGN